MQWPNIHIVIKIKYKKGKGRREERLCFTKLEHNAPRPVAGTMEAGNRTFGNPPSATILKPPLSSAVKETHVRISTTFSLLLNNLSEAGMFHVGGDLAALPILVSNARRGGFQTASRDGEL